MSKRLYVLGLAALVGVGCQAADEQESGAQQQTTTVGRADRSGDHGLELTVSPLQAVVPIGGPLLVRINIINLADTVVQFRPVLNFGRWLDAEIVDSSGSRIAKTMAVDPPNAVTISLGTGESITDTVDLRCSLPGGPPGIACEGPYDDLSTPGVYEVTMHFVLPCDIEGCDEVVRLEAEAFSVRVSNDTN